MRSSGLSLGAYVRGHVATLLIGVTAVASLWPLLRLTGMSCQLALLFCGMAASVFAVAGAVNYLKARSWCRQFAELAAQPDMALSLAGELRMPDAAEGRLPYEALVALRSQAAREVGRAQRRETEHREYVETWVHEIKTPLAACRLMLDNAPDAVPVGFRAELDRIDSLVEQALFFARSSCVEKDFRVRACDGGDVVRQALRSRASALVAAHVSVGMDGLDGTVLLADPKWVVFILGQLLDNSVRYRVEGRPCRIEFRARRLDEGRAAERVVLELSDNGCGVSAADMGRVWDKGFTGANGRTHAKSTGIGLYLVRRLCDKMGVGVSMKSELGQGTCVSLSFPANRMHLLDA